MADPVDLYDDYGDLITVEADVIATDRPPGVIIEFADDITRMRLSGERLAAFTEAVDRAAAHLAAIASGSDDE